MVSRYALKTSNDLQIMDGLAMDKLTLSTMQELGLKCIRSKKDRPIDRRNAVKRWGDAVNLKDYAVHHMFDGRIGLAPIEIHRAIHHKGYFWRLKHTDADA